MTFEWTVFFGDAADAEARVYVLATPISDSAETATAAALDGLKLTGRVEGPKCRYSHTLPARIPVRHRGVRSSDGKAELARPELVGEAIVPDPNFWTPELPFLYRAIVEVRRGDEVVATYEQDFGIRPLGVRGKRLVFDGKTWVPRIGRWDPRTAEELDSWRQADMVLCQSQPTDELCDAASRYGVMLVASAFFDRAQIIEQLKSWNRFPAVAFVTIESTEELDRKELRAAAPNVLFVQLWLGVEPPAEWADVIVIMGERAEDYLKYAPISKPVIAYYAIYTDGEPREARAKCDLLQAELAGKFDAAGYCV